MEDRRWERYGAATGILFVITLIVGFAIQPSPPDLEDSAVVVATYYEAHKDGVRVTIAVLSLALFFFVWFISTLRAFLARFEGKGERLSTAAFGGGLVAAAALAVSLTATAVAAFRPDQTPPDITRVLNDFGLLCISVTTFAIVAFFLANAIVILRTGALPAWLGWLGVAAAASNALAIGNIFTDSGAFAADGVLGFFVGFILFVVWIAATSIVLARALGGTTEVESPG